MRIRTIVCSSLLSGIAGNALACELPKIAIIPAKDQVAGKEAEIRAAASAYFTAMQAFSACIQAELVGAGGDAAPPIVRRILVDRNNAAVAEAQFMMKLYTENVGPIEGQPIDSPSVNRP